MKKKKEDIKKVVLAYSGGLDTSIIIPWLKENYNNCEVVAVSGDVGQGTELDGLEEKALKTGASKLYVLDLKKDYVENYIWPCLKADAKYEEYLLGTSHARPCIAKALAEIAKKENADAICHGCTGKGNDQVRFELTLKALAPEMAIIAPWREWDIKSRDEEIDYAEAHKVPLKISRETNYSKDKNLWHLSHEGLDLEDPANEPDIAYPYLFSYFKGEAWRTQKLVRQLLKDCYHNAPNGVPGNEDTGTMSAWAIFSMMGFYPACPGDVNYVLTSPTFDKVTIQLDKKFYPKGELVIESKHSNPEAIYIKDVFAGDKKLKGYTISQEDLVNAGTLRYILEDTHK